MKSFKQFHEEREQIDEDMSDAIQSFVNFHRKNKNTPLHRNLWKISRMFDVNYKRLEDELHQRILRGMIPKEFAYRKDVLNKLKDN